MSYPKIAVVGAGLAGLACARLLPPTTVVFEKSTALGGRCATKQWASSSVDHGVQCFTLNSPIVRNLLCPLLSDELCTLPKDSVVSKTVLPHTHGPANASDMYYCSSGNSTIGKVLADGVNVVHGVTVTQVLASGEMFYKTRSEESKTLSDQFDLIICTPPLPQISALLGSELDIASFVPNLTALLRYDLSKVPNSSPIHMSISESSPYAFISDTQYGPFWSACENAKRGRQLEPGGAIIVVQSSDSFSTQFFESPSEEWVSTLRQHAEEKWGIPSQAYMDSFGKRWRFAKVAPAGKELERAISSHGGIEFSERILLCGDGVSGVSGVSGVENALLQGIDAATKAKELLNLG